MTLIDPPGFESRSLLFEQTVDFPQVLALPHRQSLPEGDVLTFRFSNGYGAVVTRAAGQSLETAFEFGVLDCTGPQPRLTVLTPVCATVLQGVSYEQVAQLLPRTARLPSHPEWQRSLVSLQNEEF